MLIKQEKYGADFGPAGSSQQPAEEIKRPVAPRQLLRSHFPSWDKKIKTKENAIMKVEDAILKRESIRAYLDKPVSSEDVEKIVEAGRWAPNAGPFHISVVRNAELLKKLNDRAYNDMINSGNEFLKQRAALPGYQPLYGAPAAIILSGPDKAPFTVHNTMLAAENMLLQATGLGLGSCFLFTITRALNGEENRDLAQEAGIPPDFSAQCGLALGYAAPENKFSMAERAMKGSVNYVD
jgi:FMN reductase [NAD(P)H]